jgi:hypothetical protein
MLMWSADAGSRKLVKYFLARGGDPHARNLVRTFLYWHSFALLVELIFLNSVLSI